MLLGPISTLRVTYPLPFFEYSEFTAQLNIDAAASAAGASIQFPALVSTLGIKSVIISPSGLQKNGSRPGPPVRVSTPESPNTLSIPESPCIISFPWFPLTKDRLPGGLHLVGTPFKEDLILFIAYVLETSGNSAQLSLSQYQ